MYKLKLKKTLINFVLYAYTEKKINLPRIILLQ